MQSTEGECPSDTFAQIVSISEVLVSQLCPPLIFDPLRFKKLADMYGRESDSDESEVNIKH